MMLPSRWIPWAYHAVWVWLLLFLLFFRFDPTTGFTSLIRFGEQRAATRLPELQSVPLATIKNHPGYDGQFYAQIAVHPQLTDAELHRAVDDTHYRARRILLPWLSYALGAGQPGPIVHIYSCLNLICWGVLAWLLLHWLPPTSWKNFGRWAAALLSAGSLESIRASLTDLPAAVLLVAGIRLWEAGRTGWAVLPLAAAGLTRETSLLAFSLLAPTSLRPLHRWLRAGVLGLLCALPILLWIVYLRGLLPQGLSGWTNFSGPFVSMFHGVSESLQELAAGQEDNGRFTFRLVAVFALIVQVIVLISVFRWESPWSRASLGFMLLLPFLGDAVWDGYWAILRTVLPMTLAFCLLLPSGRWFWLLLALGSLPSLHAIFRLAF